MAAVAALWCYPVKGCAGVPLEAADLTLAGLAHDRVFMVVDAAGAARTQRRDPRLALIQPVVSPDGDQLTLRAPNCDPLVIAVTRRAPAEPVRLFAEALTGVDQGPAAAAWLSDVVGAPSRLVRTPPDHARVAGGEVEGRAGYADSSAVHLISAASIAELNARITRQGDPPTPLERFRPNIVVTGWPTPHTEDTARRLRVNGAELAFAKPAIRCAVTMVDQRTAGKAGPEPLRTLARYRRSSRGGVAFGANFAVARAGRLAVGDPVRITAWRDADVSR